MIGRSCVIELTFAALGGAALGLLVVRAPLISVSDAQVKTNAARGAGHAGVIIEDFEFRTLQNNRARVRTQRDQVVVDTSYGRLIQVTQIRGRTVLWFEAENGVVRNVFIEGDAAPVKITRQP
jgi:hypothetical protein